MTDEQRLRGYIDAWWIGVGDFLALAESLPDDAWATPTDLDGWDVHAVVAHVAHLEAVLAGAPEQFVDIGSPAHVKNPVGFYTEQGVVARRDRTPAELIGEIRWAASTRHTELLADPPTDGTGKPTRIFAGLPWDWNQFLRNRTVDIWMHDQDVRRAVGMPGGLDTDCAAVAVDHLAGGLGMVIAKRATAPAGSVVAVEITPGEPRIFRVDDEGRAVRVDAVPAGVEPTVSIVMDRAAFAVLAGGRGRVRDDAVTLTGDAELGRRIVEHLAVTP